VSSYPVHHDQGESRTEWTPPPKKNIHIYFGQIGRHDSVMDMW